MIYAYIFVMAGVTYLIRMLPLTLIQKKISNSYIRSFLYYIPYACLTAMTFPAIFVCNAISGVSFSWICSGRVAGAEETKSGDCGFVFLRGCICGRADNGVV